MICGVRASGWSKIRQTERALPALRGAQGTAGGAG